jgi:hypothetical protein
MATFAKKSGPIKKEGDGSKLKLDFEAKPAYFR